MTSTATSPRGITVAQMRAALADLDDDAQCIIWLESRTDYFHILDVAAQDELLVIDVDETDRYMP